MITEYYEQIEDILEAGRVSLSTIKPSAFNEKFRVMDTSVSPFPGPFSYKVNPYCREIVDCFSPDHPARILAVMKGAQVGFSAGVIEAAIGWIISQNPGNILFLTGHADLSEEAMDKIDQMIDSCGLRNLIRPNVMRKKASKTGDTNSKKEFPGGSLIAGSAGNHKLLRQRSVRYGFIDDFEAAKTSTKESGSTRKMIEQRFAAYYDKMKLAYISTPELKSKSNIEPVYLLGDQRKYMIPCQECGLFIDLRWSTTLKNSETDSAGITWKVDHRGNLVNGSVGYICQECGGFFTDKNKFEMNLAGFWQPTAVPSEEGFYSYHLSSLYAPAGMYDWKHYVNDWLKANPEGKNRDETLYKTFVNVVLGETYEEPGEAPKATQIQQNIRNYEVSTVPEKLSIKDGNGKIIMITLACDLNGVLEDARLDWELLAWSETGSTYSIRHGSIGTFVPKEGQKKFKEDRERWTYEMYRPNSVWPEFTKIIMDTYPTDTGRRMKVFITGIDTGHYTTQAYAYIDKMNNPLIIGLKGKDADKYIKLGIDLPSFKPARERELLYLVEVNQVKDDLAALMRLQWDPGLEAFQPPGFMNYPIPSGGLYLYNNFFSHYESEQRVVESKDGLGIAARWQKITPNHQNHFWDVRVYGMVLRDIFISVLGKSYKLPNFTWGDYVESFKNKKT